MNTKIPALPKSFLIGSLLVVLFVLMISGASMYAPRCGPDSPRGDTIGGVIKIYGC